MQIQKSQSKKGILVFLSLTLIFSSIVWILTLHEGNGRIGGRIYGFGIMWCPALATFVTCRILGIDLRVLAWQWGKSKYLYQAYFIPLVYALISYLIIWTTGWGGFYNKEFINDATQSLGWTKLSPAVFIMIFFIVNGVIQIFGGMATALGEEIGWRGFLTPQLSNVTNYTYTSLITGLIWAVWHFPLLIFGNYNNGAPVWYGLICFTVLVVSMTFVYTWFRLKSDSLWPCVMLHASHNLFIQTFFTPITIAHSQSKYFVDEFGAVLPIVALCFAIYFWSRRKELVYNLSYF